MASSVPNVAVIGAGLSGLALALALHQQSIPCTIYETRAAPLDIGGAIMLSPNALKVLDALGVYEQVRTKGYNFDLLQFKNGDGKLLETFEFGGKEKYGYHGLRIYRYVLIDELLTAIQERGIPVQYGRKFAHIVSETGTDVTWQFTDGSTETASILVGADGIHSTVRKYLYPDLKPTFTGAGGITAAVPTAQLKKPVGYHLPVTILTPQGGFVIAPQQCDGSEVLIGVQKHLEDRDRAGWESFLADKETLVGLLQKDSQSFPEIVQNAVSHIPHDKINVWPFYVVPKLDKWASSRLRVVILGDAAHAIPPTAGQGINQAFEDVYMFSLLLGQADKVPMTEAVTFWQSYRQGRIDQVMELNAQIDLRRMPGVQGATAQKEFELGWLFEPHFEKDVKDWIAERGAHEEVKRA